MPGTKIPVPTPHLHISLPTARLAFRMSLHTAGGFFGTFCRARCCLLHLTRNPFPEARPIKVHASEVSKFLGRVTSIGIAGHANIATSIQGDLGRAIAK